MSRLQQLTADILPWIATSGRLGDEVQFVDCVCDDSSSGVAQFASSVSFVVGVFRSETSGTFEQPLLIKYNTGDEAARNWLKFDHQFRNEVIVYEKVLPFLNKDDKNAEIFPRYFYGSASSNGDPNDFVIVLEDLRSSGYRLTSEILDLDFAHCSLAFKKLGTFHAFSYAAKQSIPKDFFRIVSNLVETKLFEENRVGWDSLYVKTITRASEPLLKMKGKFEKIQSLKDKLKDSLTYFRNIYSVQEPMGVICHGDFCRNNVLYKYENGSPTDVKFFDLATSRYGSPMLDFSFFLFLNCSEQSRKLHREEYLKIYHDSLTSSLPGVTVPSLEDFKEEFRRKAVYGFLLCSFFKPAMMDPEPFNPSEEVRKSVEERTSKVIVRGGDRGTEVIAGMLNELIDLNCIT